MWRWWWASKEAKETDEVANSVEDTGVPMTVTERDAAEHWWDTMQDNSTKKVIELFPKLDQSALKRVLAKKVGAGRDGPLHLLARFDNKEAFDSLRAQARATWMFEPAALEAPGVDGRTPLLICALKGHAGMLRRLIKAGANVDAEFKETDVANTAVVNDRLTALEVFVKLMREKDKNWKFKNNPLASAAVATRTRMLDFLFKEFGDNLDFNEISRNGPCSGLTPLSAACLQGNAASVRWLLDLDRDRLEVNKQDKSERTAYHYAFIAGHPEVILLMQGSKTHTVDGSVKDKHGKLPEDYEPENIEYTPLYDDEAITDDEDDADMRDDVEPDDKSTSSKAKKSASSRSKSKSKSPRKKPSKTEQENPEADGEEAPASRSPSALSNGDGSRSSADRKRRRRTNDPTYRPTAQERKEVAVEEAKDDVLGKEWELRRRQAEVKADPVGEVAAAQQAVARSAKPSRSPKPRSKRKSTPRSPAAAAAVPRRSPRRQGRTRLDARQ